MSGAEVRLASAGASLAVAAEALVGSPFRLHGRDPETGLACVGVVVAAMGETGRTAAFPTGYTLKRRVVDGLEGIAAKLGYREASGPVRRDDVVMYRVGACQFHFGIATGSTEVVHAHAGLRRVVCGAVPTDWLLCGQWRLDQPAT